MAANRPDSLTQVRLLTYAMFDGAIDVQGVAQLERLILSDSRCLQTYLEVVNFHNDLIVQADLKEDREAALSVLQQFTVACDHRRARQQRRTLFLCVASSMLLCVGMGWMLYSRMSAPLSLGSISHMSSNARLGSGTAELGRVLRQGNLLNVNEGIVSVELDHVLLDVVGPAEVKLEDSRQILLHKGKVTAHVSPGGEGFLVRTPDAEITDYGTVFAVNYDTQRGTDVVVRQGRVKASLLNSQGRVDKVLDLTSDRAARLNLPQGLMEETLFQPEIFQEVDRTRGQIRALSGQLRTLAESPTSLVSEQLPTPNHLLVIPERQAVRLEKDLTIATGTEQATIPAGTIVNSYLVHYDPTVRAIHAPRGTITFFGQIAATIINSADLRATDSLFGLPDTIYDGRPSRGLEPGADEIQVTNDRRAVSFFFGMAPPEYLDQVRILVLTD